MWCLGSAASFQRQGGGRSIVLGPFLVAELYFRWYDD